MKATIQEQFEGKHMGGVSGYHWATPDIIIHHNPTGMPESLNKGRVEKWIDAIFEYTNQAAGTSFVHLKDSTYNHLDRDDGNIVAFWHKQPQSILGRTLLHPGFIDDTGEAHWADSTVGMNAKHRNYLTGTKNSDMAAAETFVHESFHAASASHCYLPYSIMYRGGVTAEMAPGRLLPHVCDLAYMNWLARQNHANVTKSLDLRPVLIWERGTQIHASLHLPCVRFKGKAFSMVLKLVGNNEFQISELQPYDSFFGNVRDYNLLNYALYDNTVLHIYTMFVPDFGIANAVLRLDGDALRLVEFNKQF